MDNWLSRTEMLIGKENLDKLANSTVAVFGCGGVGSYVAEGIVRAGIGNIVLIDNDVVDITNINRQLIADTTTINMPKVEVEKERLLKINPNLNIQIYKEFYNSTNSNLLNNNYTYIKNKTNKNRCQVFIIES